MQRSILILGQGTNTLWATQAATNSFYGVVQGPFFQDAGFTNTTGNANGGYAECAFACVLSRGFHCVGAYATTGPTLTTNVNVQGQIAASSAATTGKGNVAAVTAPATIANPSYWYDATDIDAITAGQKIGLMQTLTACTSTPLNPSLGVVCDSVNQGFCSPFIFPLNNATPMSYLNGPFYSHLGGNSGSGGAGFTSTISLAQDYCPGAFVASWLQWQNTATGSSDTFGQTTSTFAYSPTAGSIGTVSSLHATISSVGAVGLFHDTTDIAAVPAGSYCGMKWTGSATSSNIKIGNAGVHITPAGNNASLLLTGVSSSGASGGVGWTGPGSTGGYQFLNTTYTTFGHPRGDNLITENMLSIPTAGVFSNLSFLSGSQAYGGTPSTITVQNGSHFSDNGSSGTVSTNAGVNFANTSLAVTASAASTWYFDLTDIAAFTPFDGFLLAVFCSAGGSGNSTTPLSVTIQGYSVNFTAPAHLGLLTQGAG